MLQKWNVKNIRILWKKFLQKWCRWKLIQMTLYAIKVGDILMKRLLPSGSWWGVLMFFVGDFEELQSEESEKFFLDEGIHQDLNLKRRLYLIGWVKIAADSFVLVGDLVVTCNKLPFKVRLNLYHETVVLQIALEVVYGGLNDSSVR